MSRIRQDDYDFPVRLLRDPTDYPARSDWLYAWHDALRDRLRDGDTLGPDPRTSGRIVAARLELDGQEYARVKFDVVEYIVRVHVGDLQP
jgi:hypothetical protein